MVSPSSLLNVSFLRGMTNVHNLENVGHHGKFFSTNWHTE